MKFFISIYEGFLNWLGFHLFKRISWFGWCFIGGTAYLTVRWTFLPYEQTFWDDIGFIWNNLLFVWLVILVRLFVHERHRAALNIIITYSIFRLLWEIASPFTNRWEINSPGTVTILNTILITGGIVLLWRDLKRRTREEI